MMTKKPRRMTVIGVGASAGGVEALVRLVTVLPSDLGCAILVVLHMPSGGPSVLARILDRRSRLPTVTAAADMRLEPDRIYVASPDHHLLVDDGRIVLSEGPTENGHRPAINALFRSIALAYGPRAISVLLSGVLDDGVLGSAAIRSCGGIAIAQSPSDALFPDMPQNAIQAGVIDHQLPVPDMGSLLRELAGRVPEDGPIAKDVRLELENRIAMAPQFQVEFDAEGLGPPSGFTCPDCRGSLATVSDGNYRCQVGHAWTAAALVRARDVEVESALWVAVRSLHEKSKLSRRMAGQMMPGMLRDRYTALADEAEHAREVLGSRVTVSGKSLGGGPG